MACLAATSTAVEVARLDMARCAGGGIILSSVATRYQLGLTRQAGLLINPPPAPTPQGTCESAMNAANSGLRSAPNDAGNFSRSWNTKPSFGGRIDGCDEVSSTATGPESCRINPPYVDVQSSRVLCKEVP